LKGKLALGIGIVIAIAMIAIRLFFIDGFNEFKTELTILSDNSERSYNEFYDELSKVYQRTGGATWEEFALLYNVSDAIEQVDTAHQLFYLKKETSYNLYNTDYILCCYEAARIKVKNEKVLDEFSELKNALNEDYSSVRHLLNNSTVDKALSWSSIGDCQMFFPFVEVAAIRDDVSNDLKKILGEMSTRIQSIESYNDAVRKEYDKQLRSAISNVGYSIRTSVESSMGGAQVFLYSEEQEHLVQTNTFGNYGYTTTRLKFNQDQFDSKLLDAFNEAYESNSLSTGAKPYYKCFGSYNSCSDWSCSQIKINAGSRDVVALVKNRSDKVIRHAYISSYSSYLFDIPNGTYKVIFYSGKGWNPEKVVINNECGPLRGGFVSMPSFTKDENLSIYGQIMTYTLSYQTNGNFTPAGSSAQEAF
jgi:hypothetical protein